jgi:hypothetical protein
MAERVSEPLVCPRCARTWPLSERFCPDCGMPLTYGGVLDDDREQATSAAHQRARKIKPQYTEGPLVRVATARHQAEAELIQGVLLEEGVPSVLKRTRGFDVPDMLAAGPRDILVPASGAEVARDVLMEADLAPPERGPIVNPARLLVWLLISVALVAVIAWIGTELVS